MPRRDEEEKFFEVTPLREFGGQTRVFCLPGAGGEVGIFREMASLMEDGQSVDAIDMQKFFDADRKFTAEQIADLCLPVIVETQARGPYHFCGYSFGAIVAYEVASRLKRDGETVGVVAMIDSGNPAFRDRLSSAETKRLQRAYFSNRIGKYAQYLASGNFRKFASSLLEIFFSRAGVGTRRLIRRAFLATNLPIPDIFRNNDRAVSEAWFAYNPPPSTLSLLLYYGEYRRGEYGGDRTLGWGLCASDAIDVEVAPEGHVEMMRGPHVRGFAARLSRIVKAPIV